MRIDLPGCGFKMCRIQFDGNCTDKKEYKRCEYQKMKDVLELIIGSHRLCVICANNQCKDSMDQDKPCVPIWNGASMDWRQ